MRTVAQIRREEQIPLKINKDSVYKPIVRVQREFPKLVIPAKLQEKLPFKSKPKNQTPKNRNTYMAKRAVVLEPGERKQRTALQMLSTIRKEQTTKRHSAQEVRLKKKNFEREKVKEKFEDVTRERKKRSFQEHGMKAAKRSKHE